ncbi:MAG TPA: hypothetical protein VLS94_01065 [Fusibacter sp.]|nr:hypothetical protein [Fusibacter sp.]
MTKDMHNKPRHVSASSRSVEMIFRNYNPKPVSDIRSRSFNRAGGSTFIVQQIFNMIKIHIIRALACTFMLICANCAGVDKLGKLQLANQRTAAEIHIRPKHWAIDVGIPNEDVPVGVEESILVRLFIHNQGNESIRLGCVRWIDNKTKVADDIKDLLPGERLEFYKGPLSRAGTSFVEVPERHSPQKIRIEIEPASKLDKDYQLAIYATWGHGIDL